MTPDQFQKLFAAKLTEIKRYAQEDLPRHIGKIAVDHYQGNFLLGGFMDEELTPWKPSKRIGRSDGAAGGYGTLLSARKDLFNSVRFTAFEGRTVISSAKPYSKIHNEGGQVNQTITITPKMRRFAWVKYYEANPDGTGEDGGQWKGLALTKKTQITRSFTMPKRQYMGRSVVLNELIQSRIHKDLKRILFTN